jgi:hypothetical protein
LIEIHVLQHLVTNFPDDSSQIGSGERLGRGKVGSSVVALGWGLGLLGLAILLSLGPGLLVRPVPTFALVASSVALPTSSLVHSELVVAQPTD